MILKALPGTNCANARKVSPSEIKGIRIECVNLVLAEAHLLLFCTNVLEVPPLAVLSSSDVLPTLLSLPLLWIPVGVGTWKHERHKYLCFH